MLVSVSRAVGLVSSGTHSHCRLASAWDWGAGLQAHRGLGLITGAGHACSPGDRGCHRHLVGCSEGFACTDLSCFLYTGTRAPHSPLRWSSTARLPPRLSSRLHRVAPSAPSARRPSLHVGLAQPFVRGWTFNFSQPSCVQLAPFNF